ncbi:PepSY domain-containing protein [Sphingomonas sp.]|uniref:PepSY-associated TM helix domain-containing protein n=1 Tax=Sphingomonas sp. TaxID=28214 RepID=UPI0025CD8136|nr:PepSY-associated TM helix domain-containing protein [Sphingomonas sp.]
MSAIREGTRQVMAWLHGWTGLMLGWVLFVMCLAGTMSVFKPEIGRWMRPEATASADRVQAIAAATTWLASDARGSTGWYLTAPDDRANTVEATYDSGGDYVARALDPVSGAPVARETLGGEFFYRLHFELQLPFPWGRWLASIAALAMLTALVTGIIAHRRIFRDFFTFRPRKGQRSWLDAHNALGVLAMPFHLMITFSGLLTLASLNMPWGIVANYGSDLAAAYRDLTPGAVDRPAAKRAAALAPIAPMLREAERRFGGAPFSRVAIANPGDAASVVTVYRSDAAQIGATVAEVSFDGPSGRVIGAWSEARPAVRSYAVIYGLHMGRFANGVLRWLYFLGGAMLTLAVASGMILWVVKRRERAPLSLANRIVERLNVGIIAGVPVAFAAYLCANRLLPLGLADRAQQEVTIALGTAGLALLAALAVPPRLAWPLLLGVLALLCLAAPVVGGGLTYLSQALARGDFVLPVTDALLVAAALAASVCVRTVTRRRTDVRRTARARAIA